MIILVSGSQVPTFASELDEMHRLRARVFSDRLGWDVRVVDGRERDHFDALHPDYLLQRSPDGTLTGCVRMLPTMGPNMLRDVFPSLAGGTIPAAPKVWEASRYCVDHQAAGASAAGLRQSTFELFAAMVEYGLYRGLDAVVAVTDLRMERILNRAGWTLDRFTPPQQMGVAEAVAGTLSVDYATLNRIRERGGLNGPALWMPFSDQRVAA